MIEPSATLELNSTGYREQVFPGTDHLVAATMPVPADENPYAVYLASLSAGEARRAMARCLDRIATLFAAHTHLPLSDPPGFHFPWARLRYQHTAAIRTLIGQQVRADGTPWSPAYRNKHLAALRRTLEHAWRLGLMTAEDYQRARTIDDFTGHRLPAGRSVAEAERHALIEHALAEGTLIGIRDAALISSLYATGCRRDEMAAARTTDYDPGRRALQVIGKGNKQREVYLTETAARHLGRWLVEGGRGEFLFRPVDRWGRVLPRAMSAGSIGKMLARRARETGTPHLSPHDLRRTFIGDLLDAGADLSTAQELAGHNSPTTTAGYDRRPARTRQAAVDRLDRT